MEGDYNSLETTVEATSTNLAVREMIFNDILVFLKIVNLKTK